MRGKYLSRKRLEELDGLLGERDKALLGLLQTCRYLSTGQIARLHFTDSVNAVAAVKAANRHTRKLKDYGLLESLDRQVGGARAGGGSYVWSLSESGVFLLNLDNKDFKQRRRFYEPSPFFMKHTLMVSEAFVQLTEICRKHRLGLVRTEMEPACWRGYKDEHGKPATMKPDMFAVTDDGKYEYYRFIEVDMNTESPSVVAEKCRRYALYYRSGIEQKEHDVFPLVVWLAYSENRKARIRQYIADSHEIPEARKSIFTVITPSEFEALILNGAEALGEPDKLEANVPDGTKEEGDK